MRPYLAEKRLLTILILLFIVSSFQIVQAYYNSDYGFSITPPESWQSQVVEGVVIQYVDPMVATTGASINVVTQTTNITLGEYMPSTKSYFAATFNDFNLLSEGYIEINELTSYQITFTHTINNATYMQQQYYFIENGRAYIITCSAFEPQFGNVAAYLVSSVNSFTLGFISPTISPNTTNQSAGDSLDLATLLAIIAVVVISLITIIGLILLIKKTKTKPAFD